MELEAFCSPVLASQNDDELRAHAVRFWAKFWTWFRTQDRATGWIKYGARWYNPTTGRFAQHDTLDAPLDPHNANRYAYAANDPINNTDPLGLYSKEEAFADVVGAGVAGLFAVPGAILGGPGGAVAGALVGGCLENAVAEGTVNALDDENTSLGDVTGSCIVGGVTGSLG